MAKTEKINSSAAIQELRGIYAALVQEKSELAAKRLKVIEKRETNEQQIVALMAKAKQAESAVNLAERQLLREEITAAQSEKITSECAAAVNALNTADRMRHLAADVIREIDKEIVESNAKTSAALRRLCAAIREDLITELNPGEVRKRLLAIYASHAHGGYGDWQKMILDIFPMPSVEESGKVRAAFAEKNNFM